MSKVDEQIEAMLQEGKTWDEVFDWALEHAPHLAPGVPGQLWRRSALSKQTTSPPSTPPSGEAPDESS